MAAAYEPPVLDDRGPLVIRPSWQALSRWQLHVFAIVLAGLALAGARLMNRSHSISWVIALLGIGGLLLGVYAIYLALLMLGMKITVTADAILVTHWFRSTASVAPSEIARVVKISLASGVRDSFPRPAVFAFSASGRCVLSLYAERWNKADLDRIWRYLRVTPEGSWDRTILESDLKVEFPGAF
jgi:hypothetical protein